MAIIRLDPFRPFRRLHPWFWGWEDEDRWPEFTMTEGVDVFEEDSKIVTKAAIPGIPSDKVEVTYEDGVLTISGKAEEKEEEKKKKKTVYKRERVTSFHYTTTLPRPIDPKSLEASVEDGVVTVVAKIAEEAKPKKVPVKVSKK